MMPFFRPQTLSVAEFNGYNVIILGNVQHFV